MAESPLQNTLQSQVQDLDRRLRNIETASRLVSSSVKEGAFTVLDSTGTTVVVLGRQSDGSYDLGILDPAGGGGLIRLTSFAFGQRAANDANTVTANSFPNWQNLGGPSVTATVGSSGRVLVLGAADVSATAGSGDFAGAIGVSVDSGTPTFPPTTVGASIADFTLGFSPAGFILRQTLSGLALLTGLSAGSHSFSLWYQKLSSAVSNTDFSNRSIVVWPL